MLCDAFEGELLHEVDFIGLGQVLVLRYRKIGRFLYVILKNHIKITVLVYDYRT